MEHNIPAGRYQRVAAEASGQQPRDHTEEGSVAAQDPGANTTHLHHVPGPEDPEHTTMLLIPSPRQGAYTEGSPASTTAADQAQPTTVNSVKARTVHQGARDRTMLLAAIRERRAVGRLRSRAARETTGRSDAGDTKDLRANRRQSVRRDRGIDLSTVALLHTPDNRARRRQHTAPHTRRQDRQAQDYNRRPSARRLTRTGIAARVAALGALLAAGGLVVSLTGDGGSTNTDRPPAATSTPPPMYGTRAPIPGEIQTPTEYTLTQGTPVDLIAQRIVRESLGDGVFDMHDTHTRQSVMAWSAAIRDENPQLPRDLTVPVYGDPNMRDVPEGTVIQRPGTLVFLYEYNKIAPPTERIAA